jgi:hypothetical protein
VAEAGDLSVFQIIQSGCGRVPKCHIQWLTGTISPEVKRLGNEANRLLHMVLILKMSPYVLLLPHMTT